MDYKEKYENAVKAATLAKQDTESAVTIGVLEEIFPELRWSEDEMISKAIYTYLKNELTNTKQPTPRTNEFEAWLAWLEKKGEQKTTIIIPKFRVGDKIRRKTPRRYDKDMQVARIESDYYLCNHLGKFSSEPISFSEESNYELVEHKPAEWSEPKFKVGDWIINKEHNNVAKVLEINNEQYRLDYCDTVGTISIALIDNDYHLWTIQDAKDGYMLVCGKDKRPFIFKGLLDKLHPECPVAYCGIAEDGIFSVSTGDGWWTDEEVYPSTKEQRYLLFQKMKEAGYIWDAEKKELKNVSQEYPLTPDECVKPNWSGEDEKIMQNLLSLWKEVMIEPTCCRFGLHKDEIVDWFKSLKDRVQLKQEWSEEDERNLQGIIDEIEANKNQAPDYDLATLATYDRFLSWLKALRHRSWLKPSDEQMRALNTMNVTGCISYAGQGQELVNLYNDLKKLREEYT